MVKYNCPTCNKEFNKKDSFLKHTEQKKKPCQPVLQKFAEICNNLQEFAEKTNKFDKESYELKNNCEYCGKNFSSVYTLNRHLSNSCKKKLDSLTKEEENIELKKKIEIQQKEIEELKKMFYDFSKQNKNTNISNTQNNIETQNNTTNTQNNNINIILPHGKEFEKIELKEVLDQMLTYDFHKMLPNLVKHIYLNKDKPENQNFVVNDMARNKCKYYNGEKWITGKANEKLLGIFENTNSLFVDPFNEPEAIKTVEFIRKNKKYADKYATILKCRKYAKSLFDEWDKESMESRQKILDK